MVVDRQEDRQTHKVSKPKKKIKSFEKHKLKNTFLVLGSVFCAHIGNYATKSARRDDQIQTLV